MSLHPVLVVDDDKKVSAALKRELEDEGYTVYIAASGDEALALLEVNPCKVVISDIKMPGMNGFELFNKVKAIYPDIIRIFLSGHSDIKLILDFVNKYGIERYLTKPWEKDDLKLNLRQAVELFDLRKEVLELRKKAQQM